MIDELLNPNITRMEILKYKGFPKKLRSIHISVYRNHAFEVMEGILQVFLKISGLQAKFFYSNYDDSFHFTTLSEANDLNIIWIDFSHYAQKNWFKDKIKQLREISKKPVLIYYTGCEDIDIDANCVVGVSSQELEKELGENFLDLEKQEYSGTRLSAKALVRVAQQLGFKYIPSFFRTPIKAIMVDMDNTLYEGVLGEDGPDNVIPNLPFQRQLKALKDKGVLLGLASKNDYDDARKLFALRKDFVLHWEDFSCHHISWKLKADSIVDAANRFHIDTADMLFVDDNWGEINHVQQSLPNTHTLIADKNLTYKLNLYPLLERYTQTQEDALRAYDIQSNLKRETLKASLRAEDYFKQLEMELTYKLDAPHTFERAIQLLNKTNQFIFAFQRYRLENLAPWQHILTVGLKDKLSDSGIIGAVVASKQDNVLKIHEVVISCRALGREIEDVLLDSAFQFLSKKLGTSQGLLIDFKTGPRNLPAKTWLEGYIGKSLVKTGSMSASIKYFPPNPFVKLIVL